MDTRQQIDRFIDDFRRTRSSVQRLIVGMEDVLDGTLICLLAGGNVLLEGVPGLGKTMLVKTLAQALHLEFRRVQFTPDLMPADILGTNMVVEEGGKRSMAFRPGPLFTHLLLADEINRATPRTQSALLEAMEEHSVTVAGVTHRLEEPFFVMATQNPIEQAGTYPLPEAQLDKFMFKLMVQNPGFEEMKVILERTTTEREIEIEPVTLREEVLRMQQLVRKVPVPEHVQDYATALILSTHSDSDLAPESVKRYGAGGASPRGLQSLIRSAKIRALLDGRFSASCEDIRASAAPALRHRIRLSFEGESLGVRPETLIEEMLSAVPQLASV